MPSSRPPLRGRGGHDLKEPRLQRVEAARERLNAQGACSRRCLSAVQLAQLDHVAVGLTGELLHVALHGDYRYDALKNTDEETRKQDASLRAALVEHCRDTSVIVSGYSGRDASVMDALRSAYAEAGTGRLYWCGFGEEIPAHVQDVPSESPATAGLSSSRTHALITACQRCCQHEPTRKIILPLR